MIRRIALLAAVLLVSLPLAAQEKQSVIPIENYLPAATNLLVSVPDGKAAIDILKRLGDSAEGLASRLAKRPGVDAGVAAARLAELVAAADGPVTFSRHEIRIPGQRLERPSFLVTFTSISGGAERIEKAAVGFLKDVVVTGPSSSMTGERLMDLTVVHFRNDDGELFVANTRGYVLVASNPFLLGLVLREMQSPGVKSLRYRAVFEEAQAIREEAGPTAGLFWCSKQALPKLLGPLGIRRLAGVLRRDGEGFQDEIRVVAEKHSLLPRLATEGAVPRVWADEAADGVWIGAAMTPKGVLSAAIAILRPEHVMQAIRIDEVANGAAEFLWRPGRAPAMAMGVTKGADALKVTRPLGDLATKRSDGSIVVSEEVSSWASAITVGASKPPVDRAGGARLKARVGTLLGLLGREDAPGSATTVIALLKQGKVVTVSSGRGEVGPIQLVLGALIP